MGMLGKLTFSFLFLVTFYSTSSFAQVGGNMIIDNCNATMSLSESNQFIDGIQQIYRDHLGRATDIPGFNFYACHFAKGNVDISDIEEDVANSPEAKRYKAARTAHLRARRSLRRSSRRSRRRRR